LVWRILCRRGYRRCGASPRRNFAGPELRPVLRWEGQIFIAWHDRAMANRISGGSRLARAAASAGSLWVHRAFVCPTGLRKALPIAYIHLADDARSVRAGADPR